MNAPGRTVATDVDSLLDASAWNGFQKSVVALVALALLFDGLDSQVLGLVIPALLDDWQVTRANMAPVVAAGLIGMSIGTALGGWAADRIGRKWSLILSVALFGAATAASALVETIGMLGAARTIAGLGLGGALPAATAMIAEYTPIKSRSIGIAVGMVTIPVGSMIGSLLSAAIIEDFGWRALFALGGLLPLILAFAFIWLLPESPRFLLLRPKRRNELLRLLTKSGCAVDDNAELSIDQPAAKPRSPLSALFDAEIRMDTILCWCAFFLTMLALYTVVSWGPAMIANEGFELSFTGTALAAFAFGGIVGGLSSGWMLARLGSRTTQLILAGGGAAVAVIAALMFTDTVPTTSMVIVAFAVLGFTITGMQNSMYVLGAHIYSTLMRGTGLGVALAVGRLGAVASAFTGALSVDLGGGFYFFLFIAVGLGFAMLAAIGVGRSVPAVAHGA